MARYLGFNLRGHHEFLDSGHHTRFVFNDGTMTVMRVRLDSNASRKGEQDYQWYTYKRFKLVPIKNGEKS